MRCIFLLLIFCWFGSASSDDAEKPAYQYAIDLYGATDVRTAARLWFQNRGNNDVVPALIRSLRYFPEDSSQTLALLKLFTQQELGERWFDWFVWMERNPTQRLANNELFLESIFSRIDPQFKVFFSPNIAREIRLDEITWEVCAKMASPR